ncbi:MAG: hypothetical protein KIT76_17865 [Pseudolabrys sp.]|nr:hypothetical protein [Pseudolabrys sp.]
MTCVKVCSRLIRHNGEMNWRILSLLALAVTVPAAAADDIYTRFFAGAANGRPCYLRVYDDAHLKRHPRQTVRRILVDFDVNIRSDETRKNGPDNFEAGIGFMLKRSPEWYGQVLSCKTVGDRADCFLEADGGRLTLTARGNDLRLEVAGGADGEIHAEGEKDFASFGGRGSDDRVFILPPADRALCDAAFPP